MNQNNSHSEFHKLSLPQHVSIERHQEMIKNASKWHRVSESPSRKELPVVISRLQLAWSTVLNLFG